MTALITHPIPARRVRLAGVFTWLSSLWPRRGDAVARWDVAAGPLLGDPPPA